MLHRLRLLASPFLHTLMRAECAAERFDSPGWGGVWRRLREKGTDIYRMKGVLAIKGQDQRFVFQGIHMLFDGQPMTPWGDETRSNKMIFIGKNLDREE